MACSCLALPLLAHADEAPAPNPQVLGIAESVLSYCGPRDPASAGKLREQIKILVQGASEEQLAAARATDEYHWGYDSVAEFVGTVDEHNARQFCSEGLVGK